MPAASQVTRADTTTTSSGLKRSAKPTTTTATPSNVSMRFPSNALRQARSVNDHSEESAQIDIERYRPLCGAVDRSSPQGREGSGGGKTPEAAPHPNRLRFARRIDRPTGGAVAFFFRLPER